MQAHPRFATNVGIVRPGLWHGKEHENKRDHCHAGQREKGRVIAGFDDQKASRPLAQRPTDALNRPEKAPAHTVAAGSAHDIGEDQRDESIKQAARDASNLDR